MFRLRQGQNFGHIRATIPENKVQQIPQVIGFTGQEPLVRVTTFKYKTAEGWRNYTQGKGTSKDKLRMPRA